MTERAARFVGVVLANRWLLVLITAVMTSATAVAVTLAVHPAADREAQPATWPGHWVNSQTRATADQTTCAGHAQAADMMRAATHVPIADPDGRHAAEVAYAQAARAMYRATAGETHFDLAFAVDTFTAALRTLTVAPASPEALAAARAADQTVTAMCARWVPKAVAAAS